MFPGAAGSGLIDVELRQYFLFFAQISHSFHKD